MGIHLLERARGMGVLQRQHIHPAPWREFQHLATATPETTRLNMV